MSHNLHVLLIVAAAVPAWIFGAIYYGLLGRKWVAAQGKTMEQHKAESASKPAAAQAVPFVLAFLAELVMAGVLSGIIFHIGVYTVRTGVITGATCWLGFMLTAVAVNNAYAHRKLMLTVIDSGHWLGVSVILGAILGGFGS